jgi:AcrR family transcriptional regulator
VSSPPKIKPPPRTRAKAAAKPPAAALSPRKARRERRRERSREEILEAARRVIVKNGVAAATLDAIAQEVGLTKAALYYYYPSKEALLFEIMFEIVSTQAQSVHDAVAKAKSGGQALRTIISETIHRFAPRMDDFRVAFLQNQVAKPGTIRFEAEQFARLRPTNDLQWAGASKLLSEDWKRARGRARVEPRLMAFLASMAALGVLTFKGMVEAVDDPLIYSDEQLIEALSRIFEAAAEP